MKIILKSVDKRKIHVIIITEGRPIDGYALKTNDVQKYTAQFLRLGRLFLFMLIVFKKTYNTDYHNYERKKVLICNILHKQPSIPRAKSATAYRYGHPSGCFSAPIKYYHIRQLLSIKDILQ